MVIGYVDKLVIGYWFDFVVLEFYKLFNEYLVMVSYEVREF